ncbi:MAG: aromatic ring-hydroxylating dioxygenase subunit alpha [Chitinophagaceae bacterium]|nr:aromatic ring-hydroxylating dioxygenase subunit alpha [Chitinophagaceae bacterium]
MNRLYVDANIAKAQTLSTDFYTSAEHLATAKEKIFAPSWQFIGSKEMVKFSGDVQPFVLLKDYMNEPLMLTKDNEGTVHCLSNVCTHRGNLVAYKACSKANHLRCKYHGRVFELSGKFVSMPEFKDVQDFPCDDDNLPVLPLFNWGNLLFTSLHPKEDAAIYFNEMMQRLNWLPIHEFTHRADLSKIFEMDANWALYCENYLEGFHIPFVHASLNAALSFGDYSTELYPRSILQIGIGKNEEDCFDLPKESEDYGSNVAAYYYWVYPNMMFNFYPWGLSINIVNPVSVNKTRVEFITFMWKEDKYDKGAGSDLDKVEIEDEEIVENVQKGIVSRFYKHGRYSVTRETGTHHFHRMIAESMNTASPTPSQGRV